MSKMTAETAEGTGSRTTEDLSGKYLTFFLGPEEYGIEILKVQEIIGIMTVTKVPRTPEYIKGVINLRGKVIAVIDLRLKFGMEFLDATEQTCIIVVRVHGVETGIVVDKVSEVMAIAAGDIEPAPSFGSGVDTGFILGIGKSRGRVTILLDVERVLTAAEVVGILPAKEESEPAA